MEGGVADDGERAWPARCGRSPLDRLTRPPVGVRIGRDELGERERLTDTAPKLVADRFELHMESLLVSRVARQSDERTMTFGPLLPGVFNRSQREESS